MNSDASHCRRERLGDIRALTGASLAYGSPETAENIGYSCSLLTDDMTVHYGEDVK